MNRQLASLKKLSLAGLRCVLRGVYVITGFTCKVLLIAFCSSMVSPWKTSSCWKIRKRTCL